MSAIFASSRTTHPMHTRIHANCISKCSLPCPRTFFFSSPLLFLSCARSYPPPGSTLGEATEKAVLRHMYNTRFLIMPFQEFMHDARCPPLR